MEMTEALRAPGNALIREHWILLANAIYASFPTSFAFPMKRIRKGSRRLTSLNERTWEGDIGCLGERAR